MSLKQILLFNKTIRVKLLLTAVLLTIVPVIILGIISYISADYTLKKEIAITNRETIIQIQKRIDGTLKDLSKHVIYQTLIPMLDTFLTGPNPEEDMLNCKDIMQTLYSFRLLNDDIDGVYLYFAGRNLMVYTKKYGQGFTSDMTELNSSIIGNIRKDNKLYFWMDRKNADGTLEVTLVRNIPFMSKSPDGYLILDINESLFLKVLLQTQFSQDGAMFVITSSGNIFSNPDRKVLKGDIGNDPLIDDIKAMSGISEKVYTADVEGEEMMVSFIVSPYNGWKYVTVIPVSELDSKFQPIKTSTILICLVLVALGLITSMLLSKRFYMVIKSVIDLIRQRNTTVMQPNGDKMDEFGYIKKYVESLQLKDEQLENEIQESKPVLKANFLQRLLSETMSLEEIGKKLKYYDIMTRSFLFTALCLEVEKSKFTSEEDENLFQFSIMNIAQEITEKFGLAIVFKTYSNRIAILFNHLPGEEGIQMRVFHLAEEIRDFASSMMKIKVTIGIGRCYEGLEMIRQSYKEAEEALQFQMVEGVGSVIYIGQLATQPSGYLYPLKKEQQIVIHIKMGNLDEVLKLVDEFSASLKSSRQVKCEYVLQSFYQLIAASTKVIYELDPEEGSLLFSYSPYQKLMELRSMDQIIIWLKGEFYPSIVNFVLNRRGQKNREIVDKSLDYIHHHYHEDLSQYVMAELVAVPISHFSKIFKDEIGMTFTDYVIMYRVEKSKELLVKTDMKIGDIAAYMRYNNSQNFIRMFKQFAGLTPAEYRTRNNVQA